MNLRQLLPLLVLALVGGFEPVFAANLIWDSGNTNNGSVIDPAGGTWNSSAGNTVWNNGSGNVPWTDGNNAIFSGADGAYIIKLGASVNAPVVTFANSGYTLTNDTPQTVTLSGTSTAVVKVLVPAGKTATIGNNVTITCPNSSFLGNTGDAPGGTLIIASGGLIQETTGNTWALDGAGTVMSVQTGGALRHNSGGSGNLAIGASNTGNAPVLRVDGGSVSINANNCSFSIASGVPGVAGILTLNSGTVTMPAGTTRPLSVGVQSGNIGTVNLNGGTLSVAQVNKGSPTAFATNNFNGGTLRAVNANFASTFMTGLDRANVRNDGAVIDSTNLAITVDQALEHSDIAGDNATDGGLTKLGAGTLTLTGTNTYTGLTVVSNGTLALSGSLAGPVMIAPGGTLSGGNSIGRISISNALTLTGTLSLRIDRTAGLTNDRVQGVTTLACGGQLSVALLGGNLQSGDVFPLFKASGYNGSFAQISLPPLTNSLAFDTTHLTVDGTLRVVTASGAPVFSAPVAPAFVSTLVGGTVAFSGIASGAQPIAYRWLFNGISLSNVAGNNLVLSNLSVSQSGYYTLVASNAYGVTTNQPAAQVTLELPQLALAPGPSVSWETLPLYQYQLLSSTNLAKPLSAWDKFGPLLLGQGDSLSEDIPKTNSGSRFFSLSVTPTPIDPQRLPPELWRDTQWNDPGGWTTVNVTSLGLLPNDPNTDASVALSNIVNSTSGRRRFYFPTGTYYFQTSYFIHNNNTWLDGDGASNTVFSIAAPGSNNIQLGFSGSSLGSPVVVAGSLSAGDSNMTMTSAASFVVGDIVQLYADNAPLTNGGQAFTSEIYSQNFKVTAINGNTLALDMKILLDYPASYTPLVQRFRAIQYVKMSRLKIVRVNQPTLEATYNYGFFYAYNCLVSQVESSFSGRDHFKFQDSKDCVIESNYVHDCWVHNTGGYGYGFTLVSATGCRLSDNKTTNLRHHYVISGCHNVISYNSVDVCYDYNDIAFHASYAYMNLVEGNMFTESYADTSKDGWSDVEPTTGPGNTWFRNYATGKVGSIQSATTRQNVIGNNVGTLVTSGSNHYLGANYVAGTNKPFGSPWTGGTTNWGVFNANALLPASLYLTSKPAFLGAKPWPLFGPGLANWGVTNILPARAAIPSTQ